MSDSRRYTRVSASSRPPCTWLGWPCGKWLLLSAATTVSILVELTAAALIVFAHSTTCHEAPSPAEVTAGQLALTELLAVVVLVWATAVAITRMWRVASAGLLCLLLPAAALVHGLRTDAWVGGFCF